MKLKIYRQSGTPVDISNQEQYTIAYREMYDKCEAKAELVYKKKTGKLTIVPHMIMLQRLLRFAERSLVRKFNGEVVVELPKTARAWTKLVSSYGDTPIMLAREANSGGLVLIIMDALNN